MHVLGEHVHLEVDFVARDQRPQRGHRQRVRQQRHLEAVGSQRGDGQADAVDGHRTLLHEVGGQRRRQGERQHAVLAEIAARGHPGSAVDVSLHHVAPQRVAGTQRRLEVDRGAGAQPAEGGAGKRLGSQLDRHRGRGDLDDGQAHSRYREAGADPEPGGELAAKADRQAHPPLPRRPRLAEDLALLLDQTCEHGLETRSRSVAWD